MPKAAAPKKLVSRDEHERVIGGIIDRAIAEGRHSRRCIRLCQGKGGHWVEEIWVVTVDKKELCRACAEGR